MALRDMFRRAEERRRANRIARLEAGLTNAAMLETVRRHAHGRCIVCGDVLEHHQVAQLAGVSAVGEDAASLIDRLQRGDYGGLPIFGPPDVQAVEIFAILCPVEQRVALLAAVTSDPWSKDALLLYRAVDDEAIVRAAVSTVGGWLPIDQPTALHAPLPRKK